MASLREERARLQFLEEHGRGDEKVHVVFIEEEARERIKNPKAKTRFQMETDDPKMYERFNAQKDRWLRLANKSVALDVMCLLWERPSDDMITNLGKEKADEQGDEDFMLGKSREAHE